ncbi:MAG: nicotinate phosphoribosyltransferase [Treponema sp.]|jgi:nicotinate phosphoribosyltransferase|nr:nicotinate phosphoribosyltransferase [Treponema sp.]
MVLLENDQERAAALCSNTSALFNDFYSLTMAQGYWKNRLNKKAVFEMFFRRQPFGGGFSLFAGLGTLLARLETFRFSKDDIVYLSGLGVFSHDFLDFLKDFHFTGNLYSLDEGTVIFPQEPLIRIEGSLIECQIIEGMLLNIINFQSLIATKTARVWLASGKGQVMEFGLRRAQGPDGAMSASRAAYIGGAGGTSNTLAARLYGIPALGTMAHSWVMAFPSEEAAFEAYAALYPDKTIFLIDTYDTLKSGAPNAIKVGKKLAAAGKNFGVRLDSGDMHYLSVQVRRMLDAAGLQQATITASNDLDEEIIQALRDAGAPINSWGVGTRMATGAEDAAFTGVYKLTARETPEGAFEATIKFSDHPEKTTNPGIKQVWRIKDKNGFAVADVLGLDHDGAGSETIERGETYTFWHPSADYRHFQHTVEGDALPLLRPRIKNGAPLLPSDSLDTIRARVRRELDSFDQSYKRLLNPHIYKVSVTERLRGMKLRLIQSRLQ